MNDKNVYLMKAAIYILADDMPDRESLKKLMLNWAKKRNLKVVDCRDFGLNPFLAENGFSGTLIKKADYEELQLGEQSLN